MKNLITPKEWNKSVVDNCIFNFILFFLLVILLNCADVGQIQSLFNNLSHPDALDDLENSWIIKRKVGLVVTFTNLWRENEYIPDPQTTKTKRPRSQGPTGEESSLAFCKINQKYMIRNKEIEEQSKCESANRCATKIRAATAPHLVCT